MFLEVLAGFGGALAGGLLMAYAAPAKSAVEIHPVYKYPGWWHYDKILINLPD